MRLTLDPAKRLLNSSTFPLLCDARTMVLLFRMYLFNELLFLESQRLILPHFHLFLSFDLIDQN